MEYDNSKLAGDIIEVEILKFVQEKYPKAYIDNTGKVNSDWDIYVPEMKYGIEVKGDYKSKYTGNLVIEVAFGDVPSALSLTKSKWWVFVEGERFIWIKPLEIYRFLMKYRQMYSVPARFIGEGDSKLKDAFLVSHKDFVLFVHNLDKCDGFVETIDKKHPLHYDNYVKKLNEIEND